MSNIDYLKSFLFNYPFGIEILMFNYSLKCVKKKKKIQQYVKKTTVFS